MEPFFNFEDFGRGIIKTTTQLLGAELGYFGNETWGWSAGWRITGEAYDWYNPSRSSRKRKAIESGTITGSKRLVTGSAKPVYGSNSGIITGSAPYFPNNNPNRRKIHLSVNDSLLSVWN